MLAELENIISRLKADEGASLSKTELQYILEQLKELKHLKEKSRLAESINNSGVSPAVKPPVVPSV